MSITHEDFQKARRISRAIEEYLQQINENGLRSTDIYPVLARKGLIEKDRHKGLHFRRFLRKLKDNDLLKLIPQCQYRTTHSEFLEWYFYRTRSDIEQDSSSTDSSSTMIQPEMTEDEINDLIEEAKPHILKLPKTDTHSFTHQMFEIRKYYPRAYEIWTDRETEIMIKAYKKFKRIDKVSELLERQPHIVKKKLDELEITDG